MAGGVGPPPRVTERADGWFRESREAHCAEYLLCLRERAAELAG